jgi:hypothetical protein
VCGRPAVMWSPWASGPDGPADETWIGIVWRVLMKNDPPGLSTTEDSEEGMHKVVLTAKNFAELSGKEEMTENRLKTSQNRYLLHRAYTEDRSDKKYLNGGVF